MDTTQAKRISLAEESHPDLQNTNDLKQSRSREDLFDWILHHIRDTKDMDMIKGSMVYGHNTCDREITLSLGPGITNSMRLITFFGLSPEEDSYRICTLAVPFVIHMNTGCRAR